MTTDSTDGGTGMARWRPVTAELAIRWSAVAVVVAVAGIAAIVSYGHAYELVSTHGEKGIAAVLSPLTADGLIYACSMVILKAAREGRRTWRDLWLAYVGLALGIAATGAANILHGLAHGPIGAVVGLWPAVALVVSYETLMWLIRAGRRSQVAPVDAEPCQCGEGGEEVAWSLPEALARVIESGMSQRQIAAAFGVHHNKVGAILRQAEPPADQVAAIEPTAVLEPA